MRGSLISGGGCSREATCKGAVRQYCTRPPATSEHERPLFGGCIAATRRMKDSRTGVKTPVGWRQSGLTIRRLCAIYFPRRKAAINKADDLLITAVVIHYITRVLKHII